MDDNYAKKTECDYNCFHYGMFGGVGGCEAQSIHESIESGQTCLHPDEKEFGTDLGVVSLLELCAALEGEIIVGGEHDNTKLVRTLTEPKI